MSRQGDRKKVFGPNSVFGFGTAPGSWLAGWLLAGPERRERNPPPLRKRRRQCSFAFLLPPSGLRFFCSGDGDCTLSRPLAGRSKSLQLLSPSLSLSARHARASKENERPRDEEERSGAGMTGFGCRIDVGGRRSRLRQKSMMPRFFSMTGERSFVPHLWRVLHALPARD
jgi:hypothetical protein